MLGKTCILAAGVFLATSPVRAEMITIQGSTTFARAIMEPHQRAIEVASGQQLTVIPNKSLPGLVALLAGEAQMAMISAALETELVKLKTLDPRINPNKLQAHEIFTTRVAIAIHEANSVKYASLAQIKRILTGEIRSWKELGGSDEPIRVVLVGGGGGVTAVVEAELMNAQKIQPPNIIYAKTPVQLVQIVAQETGAIGFAQLALLKTPGLAELRTNEAVQQSLSLVTLGEPTLEMLAVISAARKVVQ